MSSLALLKQHDLFESSLSTRFSVATTTDIEQLLAANAPVAVGVSGGKDSQAAALATYAHLDRIGHTGPRVLVHSDLGRTEWEASHPTCVQLATHLSTELITVKRAKGDMFARWEERYESNVLRYANLEVMKLVLPWSTPMQRFCTSELKVAPLVSALKKRFPKQQIISVSGIRREESATRKRMPVAKVFEKLGTSRITCFSWHPIIDWTIDDVFDFIEKSRLALHPAYRVHGASRVSCCYCILSTLRDLLAASGVPANAAIYRLIVDLEIRSAFSFQSTRWLGDVAPHLLESHQIEGIARAKEIARRRQELEAQIPQDLLFTKAGWPARIATPIEADIVACVRREIARDLDRPIGYTTGQGVYTRIVELHAARLERAA